MIALGTTLCFLSSLKAAKQSPSKQRYRSQYFTEFSTSVQERRNERARSSSSSIEASFCAKSYTGNIIR